VLTVALVTAVLVAANLGVPVPPAAALAKPPQPAADGTGAQQYRAMVDDAVEQVAAKLGVPQLTTDPLIEPLQQKLGGGGQYAHSWFYGDPFSACLIQIQPAGQKLKALDTRFVLTHEVVHCYQAQETNGSDVTNWVEEGAAMWVAAKLVPGSKITTQKWGPYLSTPVKSLYKRSYDAVGFFGHLEHVGVDVWPRIVPMMQAPDDQAAFEIAVAGSPAALDDWPSGLARDTAAGPAWATDGPGIPATQPPRIKKAVTNSTSFSYPLARAANALIALDVKSDVVLVNAAGGTRGRLRDQAGSDWVLPEISGRPLCALANGCVCPDGSPGAGIDFETLAPGGALLGETGGPNVGKVTVRGRSLDNYCKKPTSVDPCLVGTWVSEVVTIDVPGLPIAGSGGSGAVLQIAKSGAGSVDLDPSTAVTTSLPGGLTGTFKLIGKTAGLLSAAKGVMTTLATTTAGAAIQIEVPGLYQQTVPLSGGSNDAKPFDGLYQCSPKTLVYTAPGLGGQSTWARQ